MYLYIAALVVRSTPPVRYRYAQGRHEDQVMNHRIPSRFGGCTGITFSTGMEYVHDVLQRREPSWELSVLVILSIGGIVVEEDVIVIIAKLDVVLFSVESYFTSQGLRDDTLFLVECFYPVHHLK